MEGSGCDVLLLVQTEPASLRAHLAARSGGAAGLASVLQRLCLALAFVEACSELCPSKILGLCSEISSCASLLPPFCIVLRLVCGAVCLPQASMQAVTYTFVYIEVATGFWKLNAGCLENRLDFAVGACNVVFESLRHLV